MKLPILENKNPRETEKHAQVCVAVTQQVGRSDLGTADSDSAPAVMVPD